MPYGPIRQPTKQPIEPIIAGAYRYPVNKDLRLTPNVLNTQFPLLDFVRAVVD